MQKQIIKMFFLFAVFLILPNFAKAAVIFETNLDSNADWNLNGEYATCEAPPCPTAPTGWTGYYANLSPKGANNRSLFITSVLSGSDHSSDNASNKALMAYYSNIYWSSGGSSEMTKILDQNYPELYMRVWIKTQPNFVWGTAGDNDSTAEAKLFRIGHWDRTGSMYNYFPGGVGSPIALVNIGRNETYMPNNSIYKTTYRCDPQATKYYTCGGTYVDLISGITRARDDGNPQYLFSGASPKSPNTTGSHSDGNWHRWDMHVKMNASIGTSDGVWQLWYDGTLVHDDQAIQWVFSGGDGISGWNSVQFGGNANNTQAPSSPQWVAYDDVVVSTTAIPDNYVLEGGTVDTTPPSAPTGLSVN